MKRLWRWLLNGLAMVSLLLCLATVVLWARSSFDQKIGHIWLSVKGSDGGFFSLASTCGDLAVMWESKQPPTTGQAINIETGEFAMPYWLLVGVFGLVPALCLLARRFLPAYRK
jgi:4-amino-4-deoxy-L-arabinose transferase-like glycosyltransferase